MSKKEIQEEASPLAPKVVLYYRVSTQKQGASGLGLEAQRQQVACCIEGAEVLGEFVDIASGRKNNRPALEQAVALCSSEGAELVIAKLDRLSRDLPFIFALRAAGVKFRACDFPDFNTLTLGIFAAFAQYEAERASERTKAALKVKRQNSPEWRKSPFTELSRLKGSLSNIERAKKNPNNKRALALLRSLEPQKLSFRKRAQMLNEAGFRTSRNKLFSGASVRQLLLSSAGRVIQGQ